MDKSDDASRSPGDATAATASHPHVGTACDSAVSSMTVYLLGYDANCSRCARTGERIKLEVGERLTVIPLQSPLMARHRETVFGDQAPWAPTLVRISGGRVEAWTGWRMGAALIQALGVAGSARVLAIVGQEQDPFGQGSALQRTIGRRPFLRTAVGAAVGALTLSGMSAPAQAAPWRISQRTSSSLLTGTAVADPMLKLLESPDAQSAFSEFYPPQKLLNDLKAGLTSQSTAADPLSSTAPLEVMAHIDERRNGKSTSVVVHHRESGRFFRSHQEESNGQVIESTAEVYEILADAGKLRVNSMSINGSIPEPADTSSGVSGPASTSEDPCGGCSGPMGPGNRTRRTATLCREEIDIACVLGFAGCVGCGPACIGSVGAACIFCLVTSCGGFVASGACCPDRGATRDVCIRCAAPL